MSFQRACCQPYGHLLEGMYCGICSLCHLNSSHIVEIDAFLFLFLLKCPILKEILEGRIGRFLYPPQVSTWFAGSAL